MSLKIDRVQLEIVINNDQARKSLRALDDEARLLTKEMKKLKEGTEEYAQKAARLKSIKLQQDAIYESIGITNMTMKELTRRQGELNGILMHMRPGTEEYKKLKAEVTAISGRIGELKGKANATGMSLRGMADGFNRYLGMVTAFAATFTGVVLGFRKIIDISNKFGESVANLSSLTGLAGDELKWLSDQAKEVAKNGTDAGIKITSGAQAIVDAYTLMGSAKPELLKNKEALDEVTQAALTMADAAKITATESVESLANTMNQFGANADQATKYINVLAAGSLEGAAAIPEVSASMVKFGAAASAANLSVEESVGLIETLAEKGLKGELAGTQLKGALLKMQTGADDTNPKIVGLNQALENMRAKNLSAAEMVKFFGLETYTAAQIIVNGADRVDYFTKAVTGTNVALEQAAVNTDTNAAALQRAKNDFEVTAITLGEKLAPALTFSTNSFTYLVKAIMAAPEFLKKNEIAIIAVVGALIAWRAAQIKSVAMSAIQHLTLQTGIGLKIKDAILLQAMIVKEEMHAAMIGKTTLAQKAAAVATITLRNALALVGGPIGAIVLGITALVGAIRYWEKNSSVAIARQNELKGAVDSVNSSINVLKITHDRYNDQLERVNRLSVTEKQDLRDKIDLTLELTRAKLLEMKSRTADLEKSNQTLSFWDALSNSFRSAGDQAKMMEMNYLQMSINGREATEPYTDAISKLEGELKNLENTSTGLNEILNAEQIADGIGSKSISELEEKIKYLGVALRNVATDSDDYKRISEKLAVANKELNAVNATTVETTGKVSDAYEKLGEQLTVLEEKLRLQVQAGASQNIIDATLDAILKLKAEKDMIDSLTKFYLAGGSMFDEAAFAKNSDKRLENEWDVAVKESTDELDQITPLMNQAMLEADYKLRLSQQTADGQKRILAQQLKDNLVSQSEYSDKIKEIDKAETANKLQLWSTALGNVADLFGEHTAAYRILASARAGIDTYLAATAALAPPPEGAGPLLGPILAGSTIIMGLANIAKINGIKIGQRARGKYDVIGNEDGRSYQADWTGKPETRIYSKPSLVAEQGAELIVDARTTKNLMMNYPGIIESIYAARVPQRASGNLQDVAQMPGTDPAFITAVNRLNDNLEKGIRGKWVLYDLEDAQDKLSKIKSNSTL